MQAYGWYFFRILDALLKSRDGMTVHQMLDLLGDEDIYPEKNTLTVLLCKKKKDGLLKVDKTPCECCARKTSYFSLTEEGRIFALSGRAVPLRERLTKNEAAA